MNNRQLLFAIATLTCAVPAAWANQETSTGPVEEVVVSALRRSTAREVDASISTLDEAAIESAAQQHFEELIQQVPNMNLSGEGSRARYFQLRGIGELEQYEGAPNPSVGFIVDDIDLSGVGGISNVFDLQRIEVLRGPQATRFGANAIAGLVYVRSAQASQEPSSHYQLTLGNDGTQAAGLSLGGSVGENTSGRFSLHRYSSDGFYRNTALGIDDSNERNELVGRGKLDWQADNGWEARLNVLYADFNNGYDAWAPDNGRTTYSDNPGRDEQQTSGSSLRISGPMADTYELVSISSYATSDILFSYDGEWGNETYWDPYGYNYVYTNDRERETISQEWRLISSPDGRLFDDRTDWLVGFYAQKLDETNRILSTGLYDDSIDTPFSYCTPCLDRNTLFSDYESTNLAVFGKLDTTLNERLNWSLGLRVERWEADYDDFFVDEIYGDPEMPVINAFSPSKTLWGGDLSLNYELSDQADFYAVLSRGYKAGGFNPSLARATGASGAGSPATITFDPEVLWNVEAGVKGEWVGGRLTGAISLFYMDRQDMQVRSSAQYTDNPNDFIYVTSNAEGHSSGLEAGLDFELNERWTAHATLGVLHTSIDDYRLEREVDIGGSIVGRDFAHAPPYSFNFGVSFQAPANGPGDWLARLDIHSAGSFYFDYSHDEKADAHSRINLRLARQWDQWEVVAWVRNLLDEQHYVRGFSFGLEPPFFARSRFTRLADPRHFGLTVNYRH